MNRRKFFSLGGAATGYSLIVCADAIASAADAAPPHQEIVKAFDAVAPPAGQAGRLGGESHMQPVDLACDVLVAGGGMAGVCAAVAAARNGAKVVLCQDRSRLGGNAGSEVKMHMVGADCLGRRPGWRESGLIEEFRLDDAANNPQRSWELWDLLLYDKVKSEPNITLLLDSPLFAAEVKDGLLQRALARCDKTEHLYRIKSKLYLDCTGDCRLALEAGAELRQGREARGEFNESLAPEQADLKTLGSSILFTARDYGRPIAFTPPKWARKITKAQLQFRDVNSWEYGYWWIETGGAQDTIRDNERLRFELLSIVLGVWDYIKNSGDKPASANWGMDWMGMIPGKRGSRRIAGDLVLTQHDLEKQGLAFDDKAAFGGWPMDDHPSGGFDATDAPPTHSVTLARPYSIPLRCLYSRNIGNLMMAGRNISTSHVAFTSTRVMATCSAIGQAVGTAAALCARENLLPRQLTQNQTRLAAFQQALLLDDQSLLQCSNADPNDLARSATVRASNEYEEAEAEHVINGLVRDLPRQFKNRWAASMAPEGVWIELAWDEPQRISRVQITFDSGFERHLTLSAENEANQGMIRGPQPETVRDYELSATDAKGKRTSLAIVKGNYQRLNRHSFQPVEAKSIRLAISATNGSELASVYEIRCYA